MESDTNKIALRARDLREVRSIPYLRDILVLTYILNTIRSSQRLIIATSDRPDSPTKPRDNLFGLLVNISFTYEAMKTASGVLKKLAGSVPKHLHNDLSWIISEVDNRPDSFFNTILVKIRNGVAFHFNLAISEDDLAQASQTFPIIFGEGLSTKIGDWSYVLADNLVTQHFARYDPSPGEPTEKAVSLLKRLSEYNRRFCGTLDRVVAELMVNYSEII